MSYHVNQMVRLSVAFFLGTADDGSPSDPSAFFVSVLSPSGRVTTFDYPSGPTIVRDGLGLYHLDIVATEPGVWTYRFEGTVGLIAAYEDSFYVETSRFP